MRRILIVLAALSVVLVGVAPAALAGPPAGSRCSGDDNYVDVCFTQNGDDVWVKDTEKDGRSAVAVWRTRGGGSGQCRNAGGYGTWKRCDYNFAECLSGGANNYIAWNNYTYDAETRDYNFISGPYQVNVSPKQCPVPV